jgi:dethiobiotin synthetase
VLIVSGTGTGVGKTVVTAAVAALAAGRGARVAVVKPAQTGLGPQAAGGRDRDGGSGGWDGGSGGSGGSGGQDGGSRDRDGGSGGWDGGDLAEVRRLAGVEDLHELARYPDPLSPEAAARVSGTAALRLDEVARCVATLAGGRDLVLVEGAGGLLVRYAEDGWTLAELARVLGAPVLLVTTAGLGTLNHTALTCEVMAGRGLRLAGGLVIGCWPAVPDLAERCNVADLEAVSGRPLGGALPCGAPTRVDFAGIARHGLGPEYGGRFDAADFRREHGAARSGHGGPPRCS